MNILSEISIVNVMDYMFELLVQTVHVFINSYSDQVFKIQSNPFEGGVSHIVAAALQTKGLIDQAAILSQLTSLDAIAGFFYMLALALAIGSVAVFGNYRQGLYLLIGPVLYTFMVTTTTTTNGVKARLGDYEVPNSVGRQNAFLEHIKAIGENGETREVSLFFATFDGITTEVFHTLIEFLLNTANIDHLKLIGREKALSYALTTMPDEFAQVSRLITRHHKECNESMIDFYRAGKGQVNESIFPARDQGDVQRDISIAKQKFKEHRIILNNKDRALKEMIHAVAGHEQEPDDIWIVDCEESWKWIAKILKDISARQLADDAVFGSEEDDSGGEGDRSQEREDVIDYLSRETGSPADEVLAAYTFRNALEHSTHSALENHIFARTPYNQEQFKYTFKDIPGAEAKGGFLGIRFFQGTIPYIQGLLLYLLSISFPFFAILLVIPGRAMSFLVWCSLWAWVKSWDVGFALVHVARELLWDAFKHRGNMNDTNIDWEDPSSIYAFISQNDPFATQNTYFEIVAFLTLSVPFLTAHMFLGATGMFSMFRNSIDQTAGRFRSFEGDAARRDISTGVNQERHQQQENVAKSAAEAINSLSPRDTRRVGTAGGHTGHQKNPNGLQTVSGKPVARDRLLDFREVSDRYNESRMIMGAQGNVIGVAYDAALHLTQMASKDYMDDLDDGFQQLRDFENKINSGVSDNSENSYVLEGGNLTSLFFMTKDEITGEKKLVLDTQVPIDVLKHEAHKDKEWAQGKNMTWREFIEKDIAEQNKDLSEGNKMKLEVSHPVRMLPPLHMEVADDAIQHLAASNPLRKRHEAGEKANWKEYLVAVHEEQTASYNYVAMLDGRHNAPGLTEASFKMGKVYNSAIGIDELGRKGLAQTENSDFSKTIMGQFIYNAVGVTVPDLTRPGIKGDPTGKNSTDGNKSTPNTAAFGEGDDGGGDD